MTDPSLAFPDMTPRPLALLALPCLLAACMHPASRPHAPARAQVLLLGEVHDNPAGHAQRAEMLRDLVEKGWRPAIAMEQFDTGQQAALDTAMDGCADAGCVVEKVATDSSAWTWEYYEPIIDLAIRNDLPLVAANLSRSDASKVVKQGFAAVLPTATIQHYALDSLPAELLAAQEKEVADGHCGMLPKQMLAPMAKAQVARDVVMAEAMRAHAGRGVVLIAGNGHVRSDIGVPYWLRRDGMAPLAEGFVEPSGDAAPYDAVHRVNAAERPDPCAQFRSSSPASGNGSN